MAGKTGRFTSIEIMRFIACVVVVATHCFEFFGGDAPVTWTAYAFTFVEFFFLLSGFFMMRHIDKRQRQELPQTAVGPYLFGKLKTFYAPFAVVACLQFVVFCILNKLGSVAEVLSSLWHFKWEFLLLQTAGFIQNPQFDFDYLVGAAWYLSAMMIALLILYPLAKNFRKVFTRVICPVAAAVIYICLVQFYGTLNVGSEFIGFISTAILRGIAGTCVGALAFELFQWLEASEVCTKTGRGRAFSQMGEIACFVIIFGSFTFGFVDAGDTGMFMVPAFAGFIVLACLNTTAISRFFNSHGTGFSAFLGKWSLYVYLIQWPIIFLAMMYLGGLSTPMIFLVVMAVSLVVSLLLMLFDTKRKGAVPVVVVCAVLLAIAFCTPLLV